MAARGPLLAALEGVEGAAALCAPATDKALLDFVEGHPVGGAASAALQQHGPLLRSLLNMGVRESRLQVELYASVSGDANTVLVLEKLRAVLDSQFFLGGAGHTLDSTDVAVASALFDVLSLAFPPSLIPAEWQPIARWFSAVCSAPLVAHALRAARLATGGVVRVGGQVDLRAEPAHVASLADASVALNAGHKKAASQRDQEDAAKGPVASASSGAAAVHAETSVAAAAAVAAAPSLPAAPASQPESNKTLPSLR